MQEVLQRLEMCKTRKTPLHPQSDGTVERYVTTVEKHPEEVRFNAPEGLGREASRWPIDQQSTRPPARLPPAWCSGGTTPALRLLPKEQSTTDHMADLVDQLHNLHHYTRQHLKVASDRMNARYDRLVNSLGFHKECRKSGWTARPGPQRSHESSGCPGKMITQVNDVVCQTQWHLRAKMLTAHLDTPAPHIRAHRDEQPYGGSRVALASYRDEVGCVINPPPPWWSNSWQSSLIGVTLSPSAKTYRLVVTRTSWHVRQVCWSCIGQVCTSEWMVSTCEQQTRCSSRVLRVYSGVKEDSYYQCEVKTVYNEDCDL
jgi:hypothetical protein